jgi:nicotinamide-nucleotide amidase
MAEPSLEVLIGQILTQRGLTLAAAESCTGGLVSHRLTDVPGASVYFLGSIVAYANQAKIDLLGVKESTLANHGAVSEETVLEMASGVRKALHADIGVATSGIAGPGGATPTKPVGLVWIALSAADASEASSAIYPGDRLAVKEQSAQAALQMVADYLNIST